MGQERPHPQDRFTENVCTRSNFGLRFLQIRFEARLMSLTTQQMVDNLTDARAQYHALVTGQAPRVVVDSNGERVEFTAANSQKLYLYIQQLAAIVEPSVSAPMPRGPAGFLF
jgi:hypothetical protein